MTLEQVEEKVKQINEEKRRISTAIDAGFCPECGADLEKVTETTYPTPKHKRSFIDKIFCFKYWVTHYVVRCKDNHSHYLKKNFITSSDCCD
jgi:hypothetical protein